MSLLPHPTDAHEAEWLCVDIAGYKIINVYKTPHSRFTTTAIPMFPHLSLYVGDFNCQHVDWGYNKASPDGENLESWTSNKTVVWPRENSQFFLSPMERRYQSGPGFREFRPGEACATPLCSHTFSVGLILEPREGWIVTSLMLTPRQTNRPKSALTSMCMEVTYKCRLLGL